MQDWINGTHIAFQCVETPSETRKTYIYRVVAKDGFIILGEVKWFPRWRCYAFYPEPNMVFEKTCLTEITNFILALSEERKQERKKQKEYEGNA